MYGKVAVQLPRADGKNASSVDLSDPDGWESMHGTPNQVKSRGLSKNPVIDLEQFPAKRLSVEASKTNPQLAHIYFYSTFFFFFFWYFHVTFTFISHSSTFVGATLVVLP